MQGLNTGKGINSQCLGDELVCSGDVVNFNDTDYELGKDRINSGCPGGELGCTGGWGGLEKGHGG